MGEEEGKTKIYYALVSCSHIKLEVIFDKHCLINE